jgi:hypothetical protein
MLLDAANFINLTTTQKLAIPSPKIGTAVWDTTLNALSMYDGTVWQTIELFGNIDGGAPDTIYLISQNINGGTP